MVFNRYRWASLFLLVIMAPVEDRRLLKGITGYTFCIINIFSYIGKVWVSIWKTHFSSNFVTKISSSYLQLEFVGFFGNFLLELRSLFLLYFMVPGLVSNEFRSRPRVDCTKCDFVFYFGSINFY